MSKKRTGRFLTIKFDRQEVETAGFEERLQKFSSMSGMSYQQLIIATIMSLKNMSVYVEMEYGDGKSQCIRKAEGNEQNGMDVCANLARSKEDAQEQRVAGDGSDEDDSLGRDKNYMELILQKAGEDG